MGNFALILVCLLLGVVLKRSGRLPASTPAVLNSFVIHIALPALTLLYLHRLPLTTEMIFPVSMAWLLFIAGTAFFYLVGRALGWNRNVIGAVALTAGFSNTSFVGFPMLEAIFGPHALGIGVLTDQPGSFLALSTLGVATASTLASGRFSVQATLGRVVRFPPFYALLAALVLSPWEYPAPLTVMLQKLAATLVPLTLVSVGFQVEIDRRTLARDWDKLGVALGYKLLLGPLLLTALFVGVLGARGEAIQITLVQAAMPPMVTGAVIAAEYGLEPRLANLIVGIGIPISIGTVLLWAWALNGV